jgi:cytochrome o ubiquinol oxidase operon protein cyoD
MSNDQARTALKHYIIGLVGSLVLTLVAYFMVTNHVFGGGWKLALVVVGLALLQFAIQLIFFLHVSAGSRPRWKLATFWFMLTIVAVIVGGSLWIMHSLNYRMMPTVEQMEEYMNSQNGL